jgi:hypothetical protein
MNSYCQERIAFGVPLNNFGQVGVHACHSARSLRVCDVHAVTDNFAAVDDCGLLP